MHRTFSFFFSPTSSSGAQLSGGQKQRVAFARAFLSDARVLLLDEATSALDNVSERAVQDALEDARAENEKTIVMVAHRLSTVKNADAIVVLDGGKVVERGTYSDLMKIENGHFVNLVMAQQMNDGEEAEEEEEEDPDEVKFVRGCQGRATRVGKTEGGASAGGKNSSLKFAGNVVRRVSDKLRYQKGGNRMITT